MSPANSAGTPAGVTSFGTNYVISETPEQTIQDWFHRTGGGGLILPDGWFGRPFDNIHRLTFLALRPQWLILELDEHLVLFFRKLKDVTTAGSELLIEGFEHCHFERLEYGGTTFQARSYAEGTVRLVAPPGS